MPKKKEWRPMPFFGDNRELERMLEDLRWEEATEEALRKLKQDVADPKPYEKEEKKYKTG